jgi:hypothetical protein
VFISNPHPNPQSAMSCTTFDTVEVCGSSPHGPTIFFNKLASATSLGKAPNGSIKKVARDSQGSSRLWAQPVEKDAPAW